jgi:hypothetical protein
MIHGVFYVNQNSHHIFMELARQISKRLNVPIKTPSTFKPREKETYIILGIHDFLPLFEKIEQEVPGIRFIIFQSEQITSQYFKNSRYISMLRRHDVYNWSPYNALELQTHGITNKGLYQFVFATHPGKAKRPIDLFFCGSRTPYREKFLQTIKSNCLTANCVFDLDWRYVDDKVLTDILTQTKCVLNIPCFKKTSLETHRINKALACGCDVITYKSNDRELNDQYEEYVYFAYDMEKVITQYLSGKMPRKRKGIPPAMSHHFYFC